MGNITIIEKNRREILHSHFQIILVLILIPFASYSFETSIYVFLANGQNGN